MSDFLIADVVSALEDGPLSYSALRTKLGATLRTGVEHPDFAASANFALHQGRIRWVPCPCSPDALEHDEDRCLLEVAQ